MGYLDGTTGIIGGILPAPHDSVRIEIGPRGSNCLYVAYEGTREALRPSGAIDALMVTSVDTETSGRDVRLRPYTKRLLPNGLIRITRTIASMKMAVDLPGIRGGAMQVSAPRSKVSWLRPANSKQ